MGIILDAASPSRKPRYETSDENSQQRPRKGDDSSEQNTREDRSCHSCERLIVGREKKDHRPKHRNCHEGCERCSPDRCKGIIPTTWSETVELITPYVVRISTPRGSGTGFVIFSAKASNICAVATAAHVINHSHYWEELTRIDHVHGARSDSLFEPEAAS
jgi:hypothetical protein